LRHGNEHQRLHSQTDEADIDEDAHGEEVVAQRDVAGGATPLPPPQNLFGEFDEIVNV
jgi:hypothetical protein